MSEFLLYKHVVNMGDLISVLPGVRHLWRQTGKKAIIYQQLNRRGEYYEGATHPTKGPDGEMVCFSQEGFDMMKPLLLSQEYIEDFRVYNGEKVDYDLDVVRLQVYCGAPNFPLHKWTWMAYPEMQCDLSERWLNGLPLNCLTMIRSGEPRWYQGSRGGKHDAIIVNFTERYRNNAINYFFLKQYEKELVFAGTEREHELFNNSWGLNTPRLIVNNFEELTDAVLGCKFFIGNQSFCWHIAEATKVKRILELSPYAQNCTSFGANGYEFYHQNQLEYLVNKLYNES